MDEMDGFAGYVRCDACQHWHAADHQCGDRAKQPGALEPRFVCVECYRVVMLDDAAVHTRGGRALCLACARRAPARTEVRR